MSETISPPAGFSLAQSPDDTPTPPAGFTLAQPATSHPQGALASKDLYRDLTPQPRTSRTQGEDIQQGVAHGLVNGSSSILGMPSDVWNMLADAHKWAIAKGAQKLGVISPETADSILHSTIGTAPGGSEFIAKHVEGLARDMGRDTSPTETTPGHYAEALASFVPTAAAVPFTGGASAGKALSQVPAAIARYGVAPALASETAGQLTKGTKLEPFARVAGAVAPEGLFQSIGAAGRAMSPLNRTTEGLSAADATSAQSLLDQSRVAKAPLTVPEAIQTATGSGTRLGDIQRVVEQSPRGAEIMRPFMAERPGQVDTLGRDAFEKIAPAGVDPYEVAPRVQAAAERGVSDANTARTQAVDPFYKAAASDRVPADEMHDFLARIDGMIASDKTGIMGPELSQLRARLVETPAKPGVPAQRIPTTTPTGATIYKSVPAVPAVAEVPITDIDNLDRARKFFRDRLDLPQWAQNATSKEEGPKISSLLGDLRQKMVSASPDFAAGKNLYQDITEKTFNPLVRSPTGQLAKAETYPAQAKILFDPNPLPGSDPAVSRAVKQVAAVDPEAAAQMVRTHLEKTFNEATQNNLPGPNQFGGPKFAAVVSGNSQQAKNLEAAVRALPNGDVRWNALRKGMDIMEGMGARQPVGSQTAFNAQINKWMEQGHPAGEFLVQAASPGRWPSLVDRVYRHVMFNRNTGELARVFTEGNVDDLRQIARAGSKSFQGQAAMVGALAKIAGPQPQREAP